MESAGQSGLPPLLSSLQTKVAGGVRPPPAAHRGTLPRGPLLRSCTRSRNGRQPDRRPPEAARLRWRRRRRAGWRRSSTPSPRRTRRRRRGGGADGGGGGSWGLAAASGGGGELCGGRPKLRAVWLWLIGNGMPTTPQDLKEFAANAEAVLATADFSAIPAALMLAFADTVVFEASARRGRRRGHSLAALSPVHTYHNASRWCAPDVPPLLAWCTSLVLPWNVPHRV